MSEARQLNENTVLVLLGASGDLAKKKLVYSLPEKSSPVAYHPCSTRLFSILQAPPRSLLLTSANTPVSIMEEYYQITSKSLALTQQKCLTMHL